MKPAIISISFLCLFFVLFLYSCSIVGSDAIDREINRLKEKYPVPELSKSEMRADFDTLVSIMERCNPQYLVRKKVTGYDLIAEIKKQRPQVENCNNTLDFIKMLKNILFLTLDEHYYIGKDVWWFQYSCYKKENK